MDHCAANSIVLQGNQADKDAVKKCALRRLMHCKNGFLGVRLVTDAFETDTSGKTRS